MPNFGLIVNGKRKRISKATLEKFRARQAERWLQEMHAEIDSRDTSDYLMDDYGPKYRKEDFIPVVKNTRQMLWDLKLPEVNVTLGDIINKLRIYFDESGPGVSSMPNDEYWALVRAVESLGFSIALTTCTPPNVYFYMHNPKLLLAKFPKFNLVRLYLEPEKNFWVG